MREKEEAGEKRFIEYGGSQPDHSCLGVIRVED